MNLYTIDRNMIYYRKIRITVITDRLIRIEYAPHKEFVDDKSQMVVKRDFQKTSFHVRKEDDFICIDTDSIQILCNGLLLSQTSLSIRSKKPLSTSYSCWRYGDTIETFGGTARTLDEVDGSCELEPGLFSRYGFSVIDDSSSMLLTSDGFVKPRKRGNKDFYFFCYGRDFLQGLKDFYFIAGKAPMIPRFALGNWWSRYYKYTGTSYLQLMDTFYEKKIPLSVSVIDMDWHLVNIEEKYGNGWTGYTWNTQLFPNPQYFLDELHRRGLKVTLNEHPADGIRSYEENYSVMARDMGMDPETKETINFDGSSRAYLDNLQKDILSPLEKQGIDFWWIDWQQGSISKVEGLDPLFTLNLTRFHASLKKGKRALIFSRYAGPGSHRYPLGFSGDTVISWESLAFQPQFTSCASNIGFGWWSHDIGGHMKGYKDNELELRWMQYGVFSPINRLHCSNSPFTSKEPWRFEPYIEKIMVDYLRLRHKLLPYLYTMDYYSYKNDIPLIRPMYYHNPDDQRAYQCKTEYYFGSSFIVAPIVTKSISHVLKGKALVYLPEGTFYDFFTNRRYEGNRNIDIYRSLQEMPVFVKEGEVIPLTEDTKASHNPLQLTVKVYMGADGSFLLYEDDNESENYKDDICVRTLLKNNWSEKKFVIEKAVGSLSLIPSKRDYSLVFVGINKTPVTVSIDGKKAQFLSSYDEVRKELTISLKDVSVQSRTCIDFPPSMHVVQRDLDADLFHLLDGFELGIELKDTIYATVAHQKLQIALSGLGALHLESDIYHAIVELLIAE